MKTARNLNIYPNIISYCVDVSKELIDKFTSCYEKVNDVFNEEYIDVYKSSDKDDPNVLIISGRARSVHEIDIQRIIDYIINFK